MTVTPMTDPETRDKVKQYIHYLNAYQKAFHLPQYVFEDLNKMCAEAVFSAASFGYQMGAGVSQGNIIIGDFSGVDETPSTRKTKKG